MGIKFRKETCSGPYAQNSSASAPGANGPSEGSEDANDGRSSPTSAPGITGSAYGKPLGAEIETEWSSRHPTKGGVDVHPAFDLDDDDDMADALDSAE